MNVAKLPGTTIDIPATGYSVREILNSMFLAGGLVLSQVSSLTGLSTQVLQNWVKRKFVSSPVNKKYSKNQFCKIVILNFLKEGIQLNIISKLVDYINRSRPDETENIVDEFELYCTFVEIIILTDLDVRKLTSSIETVLDGCDKPYLGWEQNAGRIFQIMGITYIGSQLKVQADILLEELNL